MLVWAPIHTGCRSQRAGCKQWNLLLWMGVFIQHASHPKSAVSTCVNGAQTRKPSIWTSNIFTWLISCSRFWCSHISSSVYHLGCEQTLAWTGEEKWLDLDLSFVWCLQMWREFVVGLGFISQTQWLSQNSFISKNYQNIHPKELLLSSGSL